MKKPFLSRYAELAIIVLFISGFLPGLFWVSLQRDSWIAAVPQLEPDFLWKIEQMSVDKRALFFLTGWKRLRAFFLLWLLSWSLLNKPFALLFFCYQGMSAGMVIELLWIKYGIKGFFFYFGMVFPQLLFYVPGFFLLGVFCLKKQGRQVEGVVRMKRSIREPLIGLGIVMIGIVLESYLNPEFLKKLSDFLLE